MKKMFFGMLVAIVAVGGSVATYASQLKSGNGKNVPQWYRYEGGDETLPGSYTATTSFPDECSGGETLCAILAEPNPANPNQPIVNSQTESHNKN